MTTRTKPAPRPRPARPERRPQRRNLFWMALAAPGMLWLVLLFIVPFYAVVAIGLGQLNRLF
jgi:ABC-type polysaccharide transport system permease subunit